MKKLMVTVILAVASMASFAELGNQVVGKDGIKRARRTSEERVKVIAPVAAGELRVRPTFNSCSVCFGAKTAIDGLEMQYRRRATYIGFWSKLFGDRTPEWKSVIEFPYYEESGDYRGSILRLKENTEYECRIMVKNAPLAVTRFRTWANEVPIAKTILLNETTKFPVRVTEKGSAKGWIRYTTKPGFVLDNQTKDQITFMVDGAEYVTFDNMTIKGSGARFVFLLEKSREIRIRNCDISRWGRVGTPRFDSSGLGRLHPVGEPAKGYGINFDGAITIRKGCSCIDVERCFVHDPLGRANSWYYSHPAGPEAVVMERPDHSTVLRYNDFIGSDLHRWNDAVESGGNFWEDGGFNRDADVYGNFMIFCNDDCIELDGGQQNVRCFDNRFEAALCGVSIQGCMVSPVYVEHNGFYSMCDEFGKSGQTIKTGGGAHGNEAYAYIYENLLWGNGCGIIWMELLRATQRNNRFCGTQEIRNKGCSQFSKSKGDQFKVDLPEASLPTDLPVRPLNFTLDRARFSDIKVAKGAVTPETLMVKATSGVSRRIKFKVAKCEAFDWFDVSPSAGTIQPHGEIKFTITFDPEKMKDRRNYRGAFIVRTPEGMSRCVSIYAETDFVPPYHAEKAGDLAVYCSELKEGEFAAIGGRPQEFTFDIPKDGRYYFMIHSKGYAKVSASVDSAKPQEAKQQNYAYPTWTLLKTHTSKDEACYHCDFKAGKHTLTIRSVSGTVQCDGLVATDNPWSFEPR